MVVTFVVGCARFSLAAPRAGEAPSATDLLRAEKLADQARKRLSQSPRLVARWAKGGSGWSGRADARTESERPVVINVRPPRKAARPH